VISFIARRLGVMVLTMICLTLAVFYLVNLEPNLKKLALAQTNSRASQTEIDSWLDRFGYRDPFLTRYAEWIGLLPKQPARDADGNPIARFSYCDEAATPKFAGVLQGDFGCSTKFRTTVAAKLFPALGATAILMFWVMVCMIPGALIIGVLAGMREGSRTDRALSVVSIATTATPEYVSGVIFTVIFASWLGWLNGSAASATFQGVTFVNFALP